MKKITALLGLAGVLLFSTACSIEDTEQIIENAVEAQENLESYYAEVSSTFKYDGENESSTYKEWNVKPDKYRTEMEDGYLHITNGEESWSYDQAENTVTVFDTSDDLTEEMPSESEIIREMLTEMLESTDVVVNGKETIADRKTIHLSVSAKEGEEEFLGDTSYDIWVDEETYMPLKMMWISEDFSSVVEYTHIEYNIDIDEALFTFDIPEDAEVLTMDDFMVDSLSLDELKEVALFDIPDLSAIPDHFEFEEANYFEEMDMATMHFSDEEHYLVLSLTTDKTEMLDETEAVSTEDFEGSYMNMFDMHFLFWSQDEVHIELMTDADALSKEELIEIATQIQ
ncbi:DUF4367 domain-containing protein [Alkalihalophilus lindianensis]|uniref:DUF4367 domain-containing protein n=1 Tax=Alkalihalophilus lindianensis TaxID=1630542 RepID=A0ABU3XEL4_9BACI|nr:DUF4367 domain-containing protein [Alkalihalophilus lindianensis]MDV2686057.1 DUF4367 domain-containing protein [Alkalihalophilus lindianensis]